MLSIIEGLSSLPSGQVQRCSFIKNSIAGTADCTSSMLTSIFNCANYMLLWLGCISSISQFQLSGHCCWIDTHLISLIHLKSIVCICNVVSYINFTVFFHSVDLKDLLPLLLKVRRLACMCCIEGRLGVCDLLLERKSTSIHGWFASIKYFSCGCEVHWVRFWVTE